MINKYNLVKVTSSIRIVSLLLVLMLAPMNKSNFVQAATPVQISEVEPDPIGNDIINPGLDPNITLSSNSVYLSSALNSTGEVNLTSNITNIPWTATISGTVPWLKVNPGSSTGNGILTFTALQANTDIINPRTAYVIIHATGIADQTIVVTQSQQMAAFSFTSQSTGALSISLQFNIGSTFYIDWGDGIQTPQTATTNVQIYSTNSYIKGNLVKVYGTGITSLSLEHNFLTTLDIQKNTSMTSLDCSYNSISSLDLSQNAQLTNLLIGYNNLSVLDISKNLSLTTLSCISNKLTSLDISNNPQLTTLYCYMNNLSSLDVSKNPLMKILYCYSNSMTFKNLPQRNPLYTSYSYAPQAKIPTSVITNKVDLSSQLTAIDINGMQQTTVYKWYTKTNGIALQLGTDYTESNGVFTFLITPTDSLYCLMSNAAFPDFTGGNSLRSVNLKVTLRIPSVTTNPITNLNVNTATGNGTITDLGNPDPIQYGVIWSTTPGGTIALSTKTSQGPISTTGAFASSITGLAPGTTYYVRAYATNVAGTGYGLEITTKTLGLLPAVTTDPITGLGTTVAIGNGTITSLGVPNPTQYGFVWSTSANPDITLPTIITKGPIALTGPFTGNITGLLSSTVYHIRAYATNDLGTSYGNDVSFTTASPVISAPAPATLSFSTFVGTASTSKTFTIGGNLESNLVITAPAGYELRESGSPSYGASVTFTPIAGVVSTKTIEVRITSAASIGNVSGNVVCTSTGAVTQNVPLTGTVSAIQLGITNPTVTLNKVYDGTVSAAVVAGTLSNVDGGDIVNVSATASYDNANFGIGKTITVSYTISGAQAYKYLVPANFTTAGDISKAAVSVTAIPDSRAYNSTTSSALIPVYGAFVPGDVVNAMPIQVYDNASVGTTHVLIPSGLTVKNAGNIDVTGNYTITYVNSPATGVITSLAVTVTAVTDSKIYNGNTVSTGLPVVGALATGDVVSAQPVQVYDNPDVGSAHVMTASGMTIKNSSSVDVTGNYTITYLTSVTPGIITKLAVTVTAVTGTKPYDGTVVSSGSPIVGLLATGDAVNATPVQVYDNANVGTNHVMTASGLTIKNGIGGNVTNNYSITYANSVAPGIITMYGVTVTALTDTKTYNGNTVSNVVPTVGALVAGDVVNTLPVQVFDNANVGTTHIMTASGLTIKNGSNVDVTTNYLISYQNSVLPGVINKLGVTVTAVTDSKIYNGTTASTASPIVGPLASGDVLNAGPIQVFDTPIIGTTHILTASGLTIKNGSNADVTNNYAINYVASPATGIITKLSVTVTAVTDNKVYNGNTVSTLSPIVGPLASGDVVNIAPLQVYDNSSVGITHILTASGLTIKNGSNADVTDNYSINYIASPATGVISKYTLTVTAVPDTKIYNGNVNSTAAPLVGTLITGDVINVAPIQVYDNSTVGNAHILTASGLTIKNGSNADETGNYTINYVPSPATGIINKYAVTVTAVTDTKTYNGSTASAGLPTLGILVTGDVVNIAPTQVFDNANVGTTHVLTASGLTIKNGSNVDVTIDYSINYLTSTATGTINKLGVTVTAVTDSKTYNGNTGSTGSPVVGALATGDIQNTAPIQVFDNANVGTTHILTASGLTIKNGSNADVTNNYAISYIASPATGVINKMSVTVTAVTDTKTYNGNVVSTGIPTVGALASGDVVNNAPSQVFDTPGVGTTHILTASGLTIKNGANTDVTTNYTINYVASPATGVINKYVVTVTAVPDTKIYDGNLLSAGNPIVGTLLAGNAVNGSPTQVFDNPTVGTTHVLTASGLTIKDGSNLDVTGNYTINYLASPATGVITKLGINVTAVTDTKIYNGTVSSSASPVVGTLAAGDVVNAAPVQVFDNANAGTTHILSASGLTIKNGSNVDVTTNYTITYLASPALGIITKLALNVTAVTDTKTYNGNTSSTGVATIGALAAGDAVNFAPIQVFDTPLVGTAHVLTASGLTIKNGSNADVTSNYAINYLSSPATGIINAKKLTVTDPTITTTKVYNGNTTAQVIPGTLSGVETVDIANVTITAVAVYDNVNVGTGKTITVTYGLTGTASGNYDVPSNFIVNTGVITGMPLSVTNPTITISKEYDGTTNALVTPGVLSGVAPLDVPNVVLTATANYDNANAGTGKTITVTYGLTGSAAEIYAIPSNFSITTGEITTKLITASVPSINTSKVYDGTTLATVTVGNLTGVVPADIANVVLTGIAAFDNANAGTSKTITVTYGLSGSAAGNYTVPSNYVINTGIITGKLLTVTAPTIITNKIYDGSTSVNITPGVLSGVETADIGNVILTATANYDNLSVGTGKTITIMYSLVGSAAGNYTAPSGFAITTGVILGIPLTASNPTITTSKVYDGTASAVVSPGVLSGVNPLDVPNVILTATATYDNANAGSGKTITVTYGLSGSGSSIYAPPLDYVINSGEITVKPLTVSTPDIIVNKVYDGTTSASVTPGILSGVEAADVPNVSLVTTATYDNPIVGTGKTINVTYGLSGSAAANYSAPSNYSVTTGIITGKPLGVLTIKLTTSKVYDGTTSAIFTVNSVSGIEKIDSLNVLLTGTATYDNANAGTGKTITVVYDLSGTASGNYILPSSYLITNGVITGKLLTISDPVVVTDKMVDGNTTAVITTLGSLTGVVPADVTNVNVSAVANYNDIAVGISKTITVVYTLSGSASGNYLAPVNFILMGAKISDNVTLDQAITSSTGCEDSNLDLNYTILTGTPTQYKITFSASTLAAGIQNINYTDLPTNASTGVLPISIPKGTKDGIYQGTLQMKNELGIESPVYNFQFTINLSSDFIIPKFDDVVLCDNSSKLFVTYQWFKDGVLIDGATKQFYNDPDGLIGAYSLKVTTTDNQTLYTCSKVLNVPLTKKISVFPSPLKMNQSCTVKLTGMSDTELAGSELSVYSIQGILVYHSTKVEKINSLYLPSIDGMYLGNVTTKDGQVFPFKVIVTK
jgi:hypothetical protein